MVLILLVGGGGLRATLAQNHSVDAVAARPTDDAVLEAGFRYLLRRAAGRWPLLRHYALVIYPNKKYGQKPSDALVQRLRAAGYDVVKWERAHGLGAIWLDAGPVTRRGKRHVLLDVRIHGIRVGKSKGLTESSRLRVARRERGWRVIGTEKGWTIRRHPWK